jgi:DNA-binding MarR family transcriptional regulator
LSGGALRYTLAALYPLIYRMEQRGWLRGEWKTGNSGKRQRCYRLLPRDRRMLKPLRAEWADLFRVLRRVAKVSHAWLGTPTCEVTLVLGVARVKQEEVVAELAARLEEYYSSLRSAGMAEEDVFLQTCARAGNWKELRHELALAQREGTIDERVKQIWIRSLVTLPSAWVALALLIWAGTRPVILHPGGARSVTSYIPWLLGLPLIGAAGGYLSRRAHGTEWRAYLAGTFPAVAIAAIFLLIFPFAFVIDPQVVPEFKLSALAAMTLSWVILPGTALCIGVALQSLRKTHRPGH